jgi:hypothetical protein
LESSLRGNTDVAVMLEEAVWADAVQQARENARAVSRVLERTANALEQSARLAADHAERQQRVGRLDEARKERLAAAHAREAADRARLQAARFGALAAEVTVADVVSHTRP